VAINMSKHSSKNQGRTKGDTRPTKGYQVQDQEDYDEDLEMQPIKNSKSTKETSSVPGMLKELTRHTSNLERCFNKLGTNEDNKALKKKLKEEWDASTLLAKQLIASSDELQTEQKWADAFEKEMERYQEIRRKIENKEKAIIRSMQASDPQTGGYDEEDGQSIRRQKQKLVDPGSAQTLQREIEERNRLVKEIEHDALEILDLYKELRELIELQRSQVEAIGDNIVDAKESVQSGTAQIQEAEEYQKKAQKKQCCLLVIVLVCALFLGLFLFFTLS